MIELVRNFRKIKICGFPVKKVQSFYEQKGPITSTFHFVNGIKIKVDHTFSVDEAIIFMQLEMRKKIDLVTSQAEAPNWMGIPIILDEKVPEGEVWVGPSSSLKTRDGVLTKEMMKTQVQKYGDWSFSSVTELNDDEKVTEYDSLKLFPSLKRNNVPWLKRSNKDIKPKSLNKRIEPGERLLFSAQAANQSKALTLEIFNQLTNRFAPQKKEVESRPDPTEYDPMDRLADILDEEE